MILLKFKCPDCGSEEVTTGATVGWSTGDQEWKVNEAHHEDPSWCNTCDTTVGALICEETEI